MRVAALMTAVFVAGLAVAAGVRLLADTSSETSEASTPRPTLTSQPSGPDTTTTTAAAPDPLRHVRGKTVAIDPGHNGSNWQHAAEINQQVNAGTLWKACDTTGTTTNDGYTESEYNLDVALRLARILRRAGAWVVLTRSDDEGWGPCITERAAIGNEAAADVAISIHADGGPATGRGFHVIHPPAIAGLTDDIAADSERLATAIRAAFRETGMPEADYVGVRGLDVRSDLGGLNLSDVPKVLFESGNMRNATDAELLRSPAFRQRAARALAEALSSFLSS